MTLTRENQIELFGAPTIRCEYYPVLLPDPETLKEIEFLNRILIKDFGLKQSQFTKMPHISIDGITCPENDEKVMNDIKTFLSTQCHLNVEFSEVGYFPGRGGITLKLGIQYPKPVLDFNSLFMTAVGGKITKLNLHLTLARYVNRELFDALQNPEVVYPQSCVCSSVAVLKKRIGEKGAYVNIGVVEFGL
ncbi:2'-5' RNA ligase family protein [Dyadobacter psychrotolerans]|uniref:2'-5' RNA ligase family protein n=1 Tax=Dyadobacter psychrotolerans TaxID=2541721 RepID=A0A4R5DSX2_9BACT|nr:2'-5' RNA ligase family protein [Dyadobacter psychrotolerans]TDE17542.1 hypothetical protein E0F88_06530 [Dyadobacter psychrotolerans]